MSILASRQGVMRVMLLFFSFLLLVLIWPLRYFNLTRTPVPWMSLFDLYLLKWSVRELFLLLDPTHCINATCGNFLYMLFSYISCFLFYFALGFFVFVFSVNFQV